MLETTLWFLKMAASSISFMDFGKFETYKFVELWSPFAFKGKLNDSYQGLAYSFESITLAKPSSYPWA
jgi:hypothetical protein